MKKLYVDYTYTAPTSFISHERILTANIVEEKTLEIESRDYKKIPFPQTCYKFEIYSQDKDFPNSEKTDVEKFFIGKAITLLQAKRLFGNFSFAYPEMKKSLQADETPVLVSNGEIFVAKIKDKIVDPHTLPRFARLSLICYDARVGKISKDRTL